MRRPASGRARGHACPHCGGTGSLSLVDHPAGLVVRCRTCGYVRAAVAGERTGSAAPRDGSERDRAAG